MYTAQMTESEAKIHTRQSLGTGKGLQYNYEIQSIFRRLCKSVQKYAKQGEPVIQVSSVSIKSGFFLLCFAFCR